MIRNTAWHKVKPGQIVSFMYKSKGSSKGYKRIVLILNPDLKYRKKSSNRTKRYVVGLNLDTAITAPITSSKLENLLGKIGGIEVDEGTLEAKLPDTMTAANTKVLYHRLKALVMKYKNWRTYERRECLKRRVYLEVDYKRIPKDILEEFSKELERKFAKQLEAAPDRAIPE